MTDPYSVGDEVSWDTDTGRARGKIVHVHRTDYDWRGYRRKASRDRPQYEIRSAASGHVVVRKGSALRLLDAPRP